MLPKSVRIVQQTNLSVDSIRENLMGLHKMMAACESVDSRVV